MKSENGELKIFIIGLNGPVIPTRREESVRLLLNDFNRFFVALRMTVLFKRILHYVQYDMGFQQILRYLRMTVLFKQILHSVQYDNNAIPAEDSRKTQSTQSPLSRNADGTGRGLGVTDR